ncbi:hypothetical protein OU994_10480 [Pseudoduganella sp. SL102]|uniref:hypothetical protein n=1 Tax=Pseudoduganella sp. SL102 TaxID=2995154 RepID=UPI00248D0911|nr:hypothetical protein [Pseudoduganella sp. SL102]WBS04667.1 hypothetical protein OU994_10480 [Pseudoduganella sp. SL102]
MVRARSCAGCGNAGRRGPGGGGHHRQRLDQGRGLTTGAQVSYEDIYALGFYGHEALYALGYVMARAIVAEEGKDAIAELTGRPGALFVERYRKVKAYGQSDAVPALHAGTLRSAGQLAACAAGTEGARLRAVPPAANHEAAPR